MAVFIRRVGGDPTVHYHASPEEAAEHWSRGNELLRAQILGLFDERAENHKGECAVDFGELIEYVDPAILEGEARDLMREARAMRIAADEPVVGPIPAAVHRWRVDCGIEGPADDPHEWTRINVWMAGPQQDWDSPSVLLKWGGLGPAALFLEGETLQDPEFMEGDTVRINSYLERVFEALVGIPSHDLLMHHWEGSERTSEVREAERKAGWDPNP